ncbi:pQ706L [African swine fever virus]|uniref:Termination factor NPH-I homolog n=1 Tax=African swine fever virus TaxID=10497 RepID=A0A0C5AWV7_ASF|nr:BA71V-Q706L (j10L) [African swine fever virus]UYB79275.1 pBQ706L [Recombinant African swine fever virus]AJL34299.1 BA71V-Q706L (j10L) [African swine fever virus]AXB49350.1 pQ706L [African swine fever virus]AXB49524.1 pQ706L [African swine fever virus]AXB49696.1 pQ706L [African swine fever virus]
MSCVHNNTSFPVQIEAYLKEVFEKYKELQESKDTSLTARFARALKYYQFLIYTAFSDPKFGIGQGENTRGLLIYHQMGMGKTILSLSLAISLSHIYNPILIAPKSLHSNFQQSLLKLIKLLYPETTDHSKELQKISRRFRFVSLDAYNMGQQIIKAGGSLNGCLLIVDEAHNLFRGIINSANDKTNARQLYNNIMQAKNIRILFLTGTPCSKDPFEMVPCFNMLSGRILLPLHYERFYTAYVNKTTNSPLNADKLLNRLVGMISYAGNQNELNKLFPTELPLIIEKVEMSPEQYRQYLLARDVENAEKHASSGMHEKINTAALCLPGSEQESGSSYYVRSRMISIFASEMLTIKEDEKLSEAVQQLPKEAFTETSSPKIVCMLKNIKTSPGPVLIYSQFVELGLHVVARFLEIEGYQCLQPLKVLEEGHNAILLHKDGKDLMVKNFAEDEPTHTLVLSSKITRFTLITGKILSKERDMIQQLWNSPLNIHGEVIKILLVSKTGAEGLDLKYGRQVHILEPYWDKAREDQVKARIIRIGSHDTLPSEEKTVQPFLYIAVANQKMFYSIPEGSQEQKTIDERFHERGLEKSHLNSAFRDLLKRAAIECAFNGESGCLMCQPTNALLFHENFERDLRLPNPCQPLVKTEVKAYSISYEGKQFFYQKNKGVGLGYTFYEYNPIIKAYIEIKPSNPLYIKLIKHVQAGTTV